LGGVRGILSIYRVLTVRPLHLEQGPEGWLFFQMRGALAEYERAKILERLKRGMVGRAKAGHVSGGTVAFGYRFIKTDHGGRCEIDEDEGGVVRRIFQLSLAGMSTRVLHGR